MHGESPRGTSNGSAWGVIPQLVLQRCSKEGQQVAKSAQHAVDRKYGNMILPPMVADGRAVHIARWQRSVEQSMQISQKG